MGAIGKQDYYRNRKGKEEFNLTLKGWEDKESGFFFMYSPTLDLTGYGETHELAVKSFEITLKEFLNHTKQKDTFYDELEHLGWTVNRRKKRVHSPDLEDLLSDNETLREINNQANVYDENYNFA